MRKRLRMRKRLIRGSFSPHMRPGYGAKGLTAPGTVVCSAKSP